MKILTLHPWEVSLEEASRIQKTLRTRVILKNSFRDIHHIKWIAGCDMSIDAAAHRVFGGVIVYTFPELKEVERKYAVRKLSFPYVPGFLSFREGPVLLDAFRLLRQAPDLVIFDGQGIAHPRGLGIASHLGLFLEKPSLGCAKSRLCGRHEEPSDKKGKWSFLLSDSGERMGIVLRTRKGVRPVYVSPGHLIDLETSLHVVLRCLDGYRIPQPTREADRFVNQVKLARTPVKGI